MASNALATPRRPRAGASGEPDLAPIELVSILLREARSRIIAMLLPHSKEALTSTEALIDIAEWILLGPDDEEDDDA